MISYINGEYFFSRRNLWMTDKLDWDASASIKSTLGVIKSSSSSQGWCFWALSKSFRPSSLHVWRGNWETWCPVSPQVSRTVRPQGSPSFEISKAEAEAKFRNKTEWPRILVEILFLMRSNSDIRVKNSKVRLCSHLGLIVLWYGRSDEC